MNSTARFSDLEWDAFLLAVRFVAALWAVIVLTPAGSLLT